MHHSYPYWSALLAATVLFPAASFVAAEEPQPALEEIVVVAQKRTQNVQDVPIAISTLSEQTIEETGIDNIHQAIPLLPGVIGSTYGIVTNAWGVRGITTNDWAIGSEPSVAIYIDEAYVGRNALAAAAFFDVAGLEALKGPQGTLFGRNAAAGAISLTTNKPAMETSAKLAVGVGNEGQYDYDAVGNVALADNFAVRLAYHGTRYEGLWNDVVNNEDMFRDEDAVRLSALWDIHDRLTATVSLNYGDQETNSNVVYNPGLSLVAPGDEYPNDVAWDFENREENETRGANVRLAWELSDSVTFTSITDVREADYAYLGDTDGTNNGEPIAAIFGGLLGPSISVSFEQEDTTFETFGQEFRLSGASGNLDWFVGVNYFTEDLEENQVVAATNTADLPELGLPFGLELVRETLALQGDNKSFGVYGDATWSVNDALRISAGLRYTRDEKEFCTRANGLGFFFLSTAGEVCRSEEWTEVTPRLVVDYRVAENALVYASVSRGYKAGGFTAAPVDTDGDFVADTVSPFDPELNLSYEVGLKSELLDNSLRLNVAAFYSDYEDIQVQTTSLSGVIIDNAAEAGILGGEIELTYAATENLLLSANYAYLDAEYEDDGVFDGNQLIYAPDQTYGVTANYTLPLPTGRISVFGAYNWQSEMFYTPINTDAQRESSYGLLQGRVAYEAGSERWDIALTGENLLDEEYGMYRENVGLGDNLVRGLPRLYKLTFNLYLAPNI